MSEEPPFTAAGDHLQAPGPPVHQRLGKFIADRLFRRESEQEKGLSEALKDLDNSIPPQIDDFHSETGQRHTRNKELHPKNVQAATTTTFSELFASERDDLLDATTSLFAELVTTGRGDTTPLAKIDHFAAAYPSNIIEKLGPSPSASTLAAILKTGKNLLQACGNDELSVSDKGVVAGLLGSAIPQLVAQKGGQSLAGLEEIATQHDIDHVKDYVDFQLRYAQGLPDIPFSAEDLVGWAAPKSSFTQETAEQAWSGEAWMGTQQRPPEWGDLGHMMAVTDQWDREYGLSMNKAEDGTMTVGFIRGIERSVSNCHKLGKGEKVFFHSHPTEATDGGVYAPLISNADITNTFAQDYGGAYLNIVCRSGITLQIDSQSASEHDAEGWSVLSGRLAGTVISSDGSVSPEAKATLQELQDAKAPFLYGINQKESSNGRTLTFVHIPWEHLDTLGVTLQDLCFNNGLAKVLPPEFVKDDMPGDLRSAIRKATASMVAEYVS